MKKTTKTSYEENKDIFYSNETAICFLDRYIFRNLRTCITTDGCVGLYKKTKKARHFDRFVLKCQNCGKTVSYGEMIHKDVPKIDIKYILHVLYLYMNRLSNYQILQMVSISEKSLLSLKKITISIFKRNISLDKIGGENKNIQIDETACNRKRTIACPTSEDVFVRGTKWVIGAIDEETGEIRLQVLEDRRANSFYGFISNNIEKKTTIKSDSFRSYPPSVELTECNHLTVNHSRGFVAPDGTHTNTIESVWARLKLEIKRRGGVMFSNLVPFIDEMNVYFKLAKEYKEDAFAKFKFLLNNI